MDIPWVEKYRPSTFQQIVMTSMNKDILQNIFKEPNVSHLLFYGPPGTGKTTSIVNLIDQYQLRMYGKREKSLLIHLNASDERGIDIIRTQITQFVNSKPLFSNGFKFVILDEVDYMTKNAQHALKYLLQHINSTNVCLCLICNYISKIESSLQGEFIRVHFNRLPTNNIKTLLRDIMNKESLRISNEELDEIMYEYKSDIRSMINYIQSNQDKYKSNDFKNELYNANYKKCVHMILEENTSNTKMVESKIHDIIKNESLDENQLLLYTIKECIFHRIKNDSKNEELFLLVENVLHNTIATNRDKLFYFLHRSREIL
jgi:replication factor C subunit 3/5